ncbi:hypothetical protein KS4_31200 [Poriferisphaera corsica]|uniref:Uncharacterized protein n=1 Tax=Poriferisphaera corsica TaxID=2528020 RepID=A0A517YXU2_9BACT|nr:hypothetical protein [Poriferisphaera corsica]QDU35043.1 hypothetical protein KS4_31200 [Poriferisphaera corsica]
MATTDQIHIHRHWYGRHHEVGGVMAETVLIMPLLVTVFGIVLFSGMSMLRFERATVMDRYAVWKDVTNGYGPGNEEEYNDTFMNGEAATLVYKVEEGPSYRTTNIMREASEGESMEALLYFEYMSALLPSQKKYIFKTTHTTDSSFFRWMGMRNIHSYERIDNEWKYSNGVTLNEYDKWTYAAPRISLEQIHTGYFYDSYDDSLQASISRGNTYAEIFREFHFDRPPYRGPIVISEDWENVDW